MKNKTGIIICAIILCTAYVSNVFAQDNGVPALPALPPLPSDAALPALPGQQSSDNGGAMSELKLPGEPTAPELPKAPELPAVSKATPPAIPPIAPIAELKTEPKKVMADNEAIITPAKQTKHKKKHVLAMHTKKHPKISVAANTPIAPLTYRTEHVPEPLYAKSYDVHNRHLPVAYNQQDYDKLVFLTAKRDDLDGLRAMLDSGIDVNTVNSEGDTPLLVAVKNNSINAARLLLLRKANLNAVGSNGLTAMQVATSAGNYTMIRALQEVGQTHQEASLVGVHVSN